MPTENENHGSHYERCDSEASDALRSLNDCSSVQELVSSDDDDDDDDNEDDDDIHGDNVSKNMRNYAQGDKFDAVSFKGLAVCSFTGSDKDFILQDSHFSSSEESTDATRTAKKIRKTIRRDAAGGQNLISELPAAFSPPHPRSRKCQRRLRNDAPTAATPSRRLALTEVDALTHILHDGVREFVRGRKFASPALSAAEDETLRQLLGETTRFCVRGAAAVSRNLAAIKEEDAAARRAEQSRAQLLVLRRRQASLEAEVRALGELEERWRRKCGEAEDCSKFLWEVEKMAAAKLEERN
uniref:Uncharacterized protein n=1 Tax=Corethron hystrix TaxID=216773 RepID=A0A7S1FZN7_9STRA|mmetsp:Transcript_581/g.1135  ORF Transcript_581/g.1135 Transcript_581/m.1135 type:complete len:298 (+) Transcript_581:126-1019(+)